MGPGYFLLFLLAVAIFFAAAHYLTNIIADWQLGKRSQITKDSDKLKSFAFRRIALTFFLIQGSIWLSSPIRTSIYQAGVGSKEEQSIKLFAVATLFPAVLIYNILCSSVKPQKVLHFICFPLGSILTVGAIWLAYDNSPNGKASVLGKTFHNAFFIAFEMRSIFVYGAVLSFLQLFLRNEKNTVGGNSSSSSEYGDNIYKDESYERDGLVSTSNPNNSNSTNLRRTNTTSAANSVPVFSFVNLMQQIGCLSFLLFGVFNKYLSLEIGDSFSADGNLVLAALIGIGTLLVPFVINPAFDALEEASRLRDIEDIGEKYSDVGIDSSSYKLGGTLNADFEANSELQSASNRPSIEQKKVKVDENTEVYNLRETSPLLVNGQRKDSSKRNSTAKRNSKKDLTSADSLIKVDKRRSAIKAVLYGAIEGLILFFQHKYILLYFP